MLCDDCQKRPATVHITKMISGQKSERNLCEECAKSQQQNWSLDDSDFSVHQFLAGLLNHEPLAAGHDRRGGLQERCPQCGLTYNQFAQTGKLGCSTCYEHFTPRLGPLLRRLHGSQVHTGKVPRRTGGGIRMRQELEGLRRRLKELVGREEFEQAAKVRDSIRSLERKIGPGE